MKFLQIVILLLLAYAGQACTLSNGKLSFQKVGSNYKVFLSQQPENDCFAYDSATLSVTLRCKATGMTETRSIGLYDTLEYQVDGMVILTGNIRWHFNGNWIMRSFSPKMFGTGSGCFEKVPDLSTPLPPSILPELTLNAGLIASNVGGTLIVLSYPDYHVETVEQFPDSFQWQLSVGWWYYYLILSDGSTIDGGVVEIL